MKAGNFFIFLLIILIACTSRAKVLKVGVALRLQDQFNTSVQSLYKGIQVAKDLFEKEHPSVHIILAPLVHGETLASVQDAARAAVEKNIPAVIGGELSEEALVLSEILEPHKIVLMTPTSSSPRVTQNRPSTFRGCFSDDQVGAALANFILKLKPKKIGVIQNVSSPYSDDLAKNFIQRWQILEPNATLDHQTVIKGQLDFSKQIDSFIKSGVTHVAMLTHQDDFLRFYTQAIARDFFPTYIGSDGWGSSQNVLLKFVKEVSKGNRFLAFRNTYWRENHDNSLSKNFVKAFRKRFSGSVDEWTAIAFDSAWVLFSAMNSAKDPSNSTQIQKEMKSINIRGLLTTDLFRFNSQNSPEKDLFIYRIDKTGINFQESLK